MPDAMTLTVILAVFVLAGAVKGVIGLGLPTVSLGLLTAAIDLPSAMALLIIPSFLTNVWQAVAGGRLRALLPRIWLFLLMAALAIPIGALALTRVDYSYLSAVLGALLMIYALIGLLGFRMTIKPSREGLVGTLLGVINGLLTGMTGSFVVPGVMYLQAIGLSRDDLIAAMGALFTVSTLGLCLSLGWNNLLNSELALQSSLAVVPALAGMALGQKVRQSISQQTFRTIFFSALFVLGAYIAARALTGL